MDQVKISAFADEAGSAIDEQIAAVKRNSLDGIEVRGTELGNISDLSFVAACYVS